MRVQDVTRNVGLAVLLAVGAEVWAAPICYQGVQLKNSAGVIQGCQYETWTANSCPDIPGYMRPILPTNNGYCLTCLYEPYYTQVQDPSTDWWTLNLRPNNFTCMSCINKPSGVVGWWSFDETPLYSESYDLSTGDTVNIDDRLATIHPGPAVSVQGKVQRAWELDGVDDYVEVADHPSLNFGPGADFSFEGWVRLPSPGNAFILLDKRVRPSSSVYYGYHIALSQGKMILQLADGGWSNWTSTIAIPSGNDWHHVAVTVDRDNTSGIRFYVDNAPAGVFNPTGRQGNLGNTANLRLGRSSLSSSGSSKLGMDEFSLYNRVLTPGELQSIYNAGRYGACKNFWPDDEAWWPGQ